MIDFGKRFNFPENIHIEYKGLCGTINNQIAVKMAEKWEDFVIEQIAMEAKASGISDLTVLNKAAVLEALQKQIPKCAIMNQDVILCPNCEFDMMGVWDYPDVRDPKYCPECGQALKWRE